MTCKEKLKLDHPGLNPDDIEMITRDTCPSKFGYLDEPKYCGDEGPSHCEQCWNRMIPEEKLAYEHTGKPIHKVKDIFEENGGVTVILEPHIKDSGDRTQFQTGAVRDMREGKGRCDLMPLEVVYRYLKVFRGDVANPIKCIWGFQDCGDTRALYEAIRCFCDYNASWSSEPTMFLEVAKHFEEGAKKYGDNNWQKGIPVHCYIDSAVRHYLKWLRGDTDEPHDRAFVWNLMCCIWEVDYGGPARSDSGHEFMKKHIHIPEQEDDVV